MRIDIVVAVSVLALPAGAQLQPTGAVARAKPLAQASFQGLGILGTGDISWAFDVSRDGRTVVGSSRYGALGVPSLMQAFVWTADGGLLALGDFDGGQVSSSGQAVSADGTVVVGEAEGHAFRWTAGGGLQDLGEWFALGVSADGSTIVGYQQLPFIGRVGVRWTAAGGLEDLGALPGDTVDAFLADASADGSVLVGQSMFDQFLVQPTLWTPAGGLVGLGDLPGGLFYALGMAISDDGAVAAGWGISDIGIEAFRWTAATGLQSLDPAGSLQFSSVAHGISGDGTLIAGAAVQAGGAALWDSVHGFRAVAGLLASHGVDLGGWVLHEAAAVERTALAVTVVGYGTNPAGKTEAWRARLPAEP
jgi:probable HAF family extracellular repeat protein